MYRRYFSELVFSHIVIFSCHFLLSGCTFLNSVLLPPFSPTHLSLPFVSVWILDIAAAAGAWCGGLSSHCVCAVWVLRYAASWRAVCRGRRVAADASRPPASLSVRRLSYTWPVITLPTHTYTNMHMVTHSLARCSTWHESQNLSDSVQICRHSGVPTHGWVACKLTWVFMLPMILLMWCKFMCVSAFIKI